jgi:DNA mismatch repair protein MSH6
MNLTITICLNSLIEIGKRSSVQDSSDDEKIVQQNSKKRRIVPDSEEEVENVDNNKIKTAAANQPKHSLSKFESTEESSKPSPKPDKKPSKKKNFESDKDSVDDDEDDYNGERPTVVKDSLLQVDNVNKVWAHETLEFLKHEKIRDKNKNRPEHHDYDPRTLHVPGDFLTKQTPAMNQWWKLKSSFFDCVFFFKVGKFYELYHMDAIVGVQELGFTFMGKDTHAHSGFPEQAYEKMASTLVDKGYKVARVEQTENPQMMEERCKREGTRDKFSKVMKREVCQVQLFLIFLLLKQFIIIILLNYLVPLPSYLDHRSWNTNFFKWSAKNDNFIYC